MLKRKSLTAPQRAANEERDAWATQYPRCWACGCAWLLETHEIVRRSETADWRHVANYVRLCKHDHEEAHGGDLTKGVLLTLKIIFDPAGYDLDWIRAHAIRKGEHPVALPVRCLWFIKDDSASPAQGAPRRTAHRAGEP